MEQIKYTVYAIRFSCDAEGNQVGVGTSLGNLKELTREEAERASLALANEYKPKTLKGFVLINIAPYRTCITYADIISLKVFSDKTVRTDFPENEKE